MNLSYNEEQRLIKDSLDKFIQQDYDFETRRKYADSELGFSEENWKQYADLGWLAIPFSEDAGGIGGGPVETMILMEAFGKGLVVEPWLSTVLMSGKLIEALGSDAQKETLLYGIIAGELKASVAHWEQGQRFAENHVATTAIQKGDSFILNGSKSFVFHGQSANKLVVSARVNGDVNSAEGIGLFVVDVDQAGVTVTPYKTVENGRAANVELSNVEVNVDQQLGDLSSTTATAIESTMDLANFAVCCEAVGIMELLYKSTVEYTKERKQFGVPIGKFQALQHRMVDMFILHEQAQSLMLMAAIKLQEGGEEARQAVAAFKVFVGQAGRKIGQEAVQIHGGMGMTDELNVGYFFKRITAIDALFGNTDYHLDRYAALLA
ncbi:MAG: acyl-CoA dehydrogenase [Pseudomonadales bacterium]|nr:acyl-CoA dehydrogenase [Pseudomonadales bacterium]